MNRTCSWLYSFYATVTKFLLGARVAIPAACSSICYHLHFLSSNRDAKRRLHRSLFEFIFCIILPLVYMALRESVLRLLEQVVDTRQI